MLVSKEISAVDLTAETFEQIKATEPKVDSFYYIERVKRDGISQSN